MHDNIIANIMGVKEKSLRELKAKYGELLPNNKTICSNRVYLWRQIAYRIQKQEYGDIPPETKSKIQQLIQQYYPINNKTLRFNSILEDKPKKPTLSRDKRLPIPGTIITKEYKGIKLQIQVLESGFEYNNKIYKSLTAIAKEITGAHWNGYLFFNL